MYKMDILPQNIILALKNALKHPHLQNPFLTLEDLDSIQSNLYTTTGTSSAYQVNSPSITSYLSPIRVDVQFHTGCVNGSTIQFNALGNLNIKIFNGETISVGDIVSGGIYSGYIIGGEFRILTVTNNIVESL